MITYWVIALNGSTVAGSFNHVTSESELFLTPEDCQHEIDTRKGWIGMGDRKKYFPLPVRLKTK